MAAEISPALEALHQAQADSFLRDVEDRLASPEVFSHSHAVDFCRRVADRLLEDARKFANVARMERRRKCGRRGQEDVTTVKVGPYVMCEPCAAIAAN